MRALSVVIIVLAAASSAFAQLPVIFSTLCLFYGLGSPTQRHQSISCCLQTMVLRPATHCTTALCAPLPVHSSLAVHAELTQHTDALAHVCNLPLQIIWTRCTPREEIITESIVGELVDEVYASRLPVERPEYEVSWMVSTNEDMSSPVQTGTLNTTADRDYTVKVR